MFAVINQISWRYTPSGMSAEQRVWRVDHRWEAPTYRFFFEFWPEAIFALPGHRRQPYNSKCIRDVCREPSASPEQQWRDSYPSGTARVFFKLEGSSADPGDFDAPWDQFLWSNSFTLLGPSPLARWELLVHTWGTFLFHPQLDTGGFLSFFGTRRWVLPHRGLRTGNRFLGIPLLRCSSHPDGCCPRRSVSSSGVLQPGRMVLPPEVVGPPAKQEAQLHPPGARGWASSGRRAWCTGPTSSIEKGFL